MLPNSQLGYSVAAVAYHMAVCEADAWMGCKFGWHIPSCRLLQSYVYIAAMTRGSNISYLVTPVNMLLGKIVRSVTSRKL
jgi:hypothetical protein